MLVDIYDPTFACMTGPDGCRCAFSSMSTPGLVKCSYVGKDNHKDLGCISKPERNEFKVSKNTQTEAWFEGIDEKRKKCVEGPVIAIVHV